MKRINEELEKLICKLYTEDNLGSTTISKQLSVSESTVRRCIKRNNIKIRGTQPLRFDNTIFDFIDTEEKAYWLGFIFADGWVGNVNSKNRGYTFAINISKKDLLHLRKWNIFTKFKGDNVKFQEECRENGKVYEKCRWQISDKHMWNILNSYGCSPNKTQNLSFPDESIFKNKSLIRHFIRGYVDGDGCVTHSTVNGHVYPKASICGTANFLNKLIEYLPKKSNLYKTSTEYLFTAEFTARKAMDILHYLYDNCSIYLNRKYNLFNEYCRSYEKSQELLQTNIGEGCDANPEISIEIKESMPS